MHRLRQTTTTTRGHARKLSKSRYVRRLGKDNFAFRVVNPWIKLPLDAVMAPNLNINIDVCEHSLYTSRSI